MVRTLVPRVFSDVGDWVEAELAGLGTYAIRVEDFHEKDKYVLRAELPGLNPDRDVTVNVDHGVLTVEAQRSEERHERYRTEFRYGALHRAVTLPSTADEDHISARYDNGILEVSVPLREPQREGRAIPVTKAD
jgi:HSP20 family protein